jgi:hypothetical protein
MAAVPRLLLDCERQFRKADQPLQLARIRSHKPYATVARRTE